MHTEHERCGWCRKIGHCDDMVEIMNRTYGDRSIDWYCSDCFFTNLVIEVSAKSKRARLIFHGITRDIKDEKDEG